MLMFAIRTRAYDRACTSRSVSVLQRAKTLNARTLTRKVPWYEAHEVQDTASSASAASKSDEHATILAREKEENEQHKLRLNFQGYQHYQHQWLKHRIVIQEWLAAGPPPISEYKLTFGKHKGKRLDEVPDSYMAKYLIPGRLRGTYVIECPIVVDAVEDFMKRNPDIESQAGPAKTKPIRSKHSKITTKEDHSLVANAGIEAHARTERR